VPPELASVEIAASQPIRGCADQHCVGIGQVLETGGNVGRLTQRQVLVTTASAHSADDDQAGMDANPDRQTRVLLALERWIQSAHRLDHAQAGSDRTLGIVFVRSGIAEINDASIRGLL
jgi:hypothetical protein